MRSCKLNLPTGAVDCARSYQAADGLTRTRHLRLKFLVVDDHPLVRDAMASVIARLGGEVEVLEAADCLSGLDAVRAHPDLDRVLLDLNLPGLRGIPALERFRREHPAAPVVVVVSMARDRDTVTEAIRHGAMGFIPKSSSRETIVNALRLVLAGSVYLPPDAVGDARAEETTMPVLSGDGHSVADLGLEQGNLPRAGSRRAHGKSASQGGTQRAQGHQPHPGRDCGSQARACGGRSARSKRRLIAPHSDHAIRSHDVGLARHRLITALSSPSDHPACFADVPFRLSIPPGRC